MALFLIGIRFLEESLHQLSGRQFKLFLKKQSSSKIKAIGGGALVAAVLQSSSVVNLMVLAFVGVGILTMQNALAVMLGANLGTTVTGWIVALAGFSLGIESVAMPVAAVSGLGYALLNRQSSGYNWCRFFLGLSLLFVGLGYMRSGMEGLVSSIGLAQFQQASLLVFFGVGFLITALIQSSSATMAIALSALYSGAISLPDGMAVVLGSEIGTTIKFFIASLGGAPVKRRVALGNFLFNCITVLVLAFLLWPVHRLLTGVIGIQDPLIALVAFQTLVNVAGILLFYPLLKPVAAFLEKRYRGEDEETQFLHTSARAEPSEAIFALEKECRLFLCYVLDLTWSCFHLTNPHTREMGLSRSFNGKTVPDKYQYIKNLYGEIHSYYLLLQKNITEKEEVEKIDRLISSVRNSMYAAKNIKDALPDTDQLRNSSNDVKYNFYLATRETVNGFCSQLYRLTADHPEQQFAALTSTYHAVTANYTGTLQQLYKETTSEQVNEEEITTLLNFNREIFTAFKSLLFGAKDYLFDREQSRYFDDLPGFIR